ncbi:hypothetical protein V8Z74_24985 [Comamonas sp. w2-DMI]|uniref:hypothetical protein n=1 Tax=Comamonas sp. w2-DMI TaxID=3126391 RepID=UPI0032E406C4
MYRSRASLSLWRTDGKHQLYEMTVACLQLPLKRNFSYKTVPDPLPDHFWDGLSEPCVSSKKSNKVAFFLFISKEVSYK